MMSINTGQNPPGGDTNVAATNQEQNPEQDWATEEIERLQALITSDPARAAKEIKALRKESQGRRKSEEDLKKLKDEQEAEAARKAAEAEKVLRENGEYKALVERLDAQLSALKEDVDKAGTERVALESEVNRLKRFEEYATNAVKTRIEAVPEDMRKHIPQFEDPLKTLEWLESSASLLVPGRKAPLLDQGTSGATKGQIQEVAKEVARESAARKVRSMF
jgi:DNA repair exonuclease SbcCD ATPase subunit